MSDEDLPKPHEGMTAEEKGKLLIRYARVGASVEALDFSGADLAELCLLSDLSWREIEHLEAHYDTGHGFYAPGLKVLADADLSGACLREASFAGVYLGGASLVRADLSGADLTEAHAAGADLSEADFSGATLVGVDLTGANLEAARIGDARFGGAWIDHETYVRSDWTPQFARHLLEHGVNGFSTFPASVMAEIRTGGGLALTFGTRLSRVDRYIIDGVIVSVLGRDTTCAIEEFVVEEGTGQTRVRLTADSPDQLLAVALVLTDIVPDIDAVVARKRQAVQLWGQRYVADNLRDQWKNTAETLRSIELRIERRKLEALVKEEPAYGVFEGFTAFKPLTFRDQAKEMITPVWAAMLDAADKGVVFTLMKGAEPLLFGEPVNMDEVHDGL